MQQQQAVRPRSGGNWVREAEHHIVRGGSLALSIVSAHAIFWFFSAMDGVDFIEPYMTWLTALAIGLLGYVILRGLTHRLQHGEKIRVYVPMCIILVGVETVCNFMKAVVGVHDDKWLALCPAPLLHPMTIATYVVLSIMPAFTVFLAYVDMDLERAKHAVGAAVSSLVGKNGPMAVAPVATVPTAFNRATQAMPKQVPASQFSAVNNGVAPSPYAAIAPYPTMVQQAQPQQGFPPTPAMATMPMPQQPMPQQPQAVPQGQGGFFNGIMNNVGRVAGAFAQQPTQHP